MGSPDEPPKGSRAIALRRRECLDANYFDEVIGDDGDDLSQRIIEAAKSKGLDPAKHGVVVPVRREWDLDKRTKSYQEKLQLLDLIDEGEAMVEVLEYNTQNLRHAGLIGLGAFVLIGASGAPLWSVLVGAAVAFGCWRLLTGAR